MHVAVQDDAVERRLVAALRTQPDLATVSGKYGYAAEVDVRIVDGPVPQDERLFTGEREARLIFVGADGEDSSVLAAARAGAWCYVLKQSRGSAVVEAVRRVAAGECLILGQIASRTAAASIVLSSLSARPQLSAAPSSSPSPLSERELQILRLVALGESSKKIGHLIGLSEQTVKNYVSGILNKTGTQRRAQAVALAARHGWLGQPA